MTRTVRTLFGLVIGLSIGAPQLAWAGDFEWPQWLGPERTGVSKETGLRAWGDKGPKQLWKVKVDGGFSAISVAGGRACTMFSDGNKEIVACLDATTGKELWRHETGPRYLDSQGGDGPRATPTMAGKMLYTVGANGLLVAIEIESGKLVWSRDLVNEYGGTIPRWGYCTSPLVIGDKVYVDVGGKPSYSVMAFSAADGKELWHAGTDKAGYSSPTRVSIDGVDMVLTFTATKLQAMSPEDGTAYFEREWETSYDVNAATPVFIAPNRIFISSAYGTGGAVYEVKLSKKAGKPVADVKAIWRNKEMKNHMATSILHEGHLYGFSDSRLTCVNVATGEKTWTKRGLGKGTLILVDSRLIVLGDDGLLVLVDASPKTYKERAKAQIFDALAWTVPSLSNGILYLRNEKELYAFDIRGAGHPSKQK